MDILMQAPMTQNHTASVLAAGTTTTISQTRAATYTIKGKIYLQGSAWSNQATPTTDAASGSTFATIAPGNGAVFIIGINAAGTMLVTGPNGSNPSGIQALDVNNKFINAPFWPSSGLQGSQTPTNSPNNFCPLGYVEIFNAASNGSAWTFGSTSFGATGITATFVDVNTLPDRLP